MAGSREPLALPGGTSALVVQSGEETGGERVEVELTLPPGSPGPPRHFHPRQEEEWHVLSGTLEVYVGDRWRELAEGQSVVIPPGTAHTLRNRTREPVRVRDVHVPALDFERYLETLDRLVRDGRITSLRNPRGLIHGAMVLVDHRADQLTASRGQRAGESILAGLGRLLGHRIA